MADPLFPEEEERLAEPGSVDEYINSQKSRLPRRLNVVRTQLDAARETPPDIAAKNAEVERTLQLPPGMLNGSPDQAKDLHQQRLIDQLYTVAPKTAERIGLDPQFAAVAQDDLDALAHVENVLKAPQGQAPTVANTVKGLFMALPRNLDRVRQGARFTFADMIDAESMKEDAQRKLAGIAGAEAQNPDFGHWLPNEVFAGGQSTVQMVPLLATAIATGKRAPVLTLMGLMTGLPEYAKFRGRGAGKAEAFAGASGAGLIEAVTELPGMGPLIKSFGGKKAMKHLLKSFLLDAAGEQVATLGQDAIDTAIANPDKSWAQYWAERPEAARATFIASLVMSGTLGSAHVAAARLARNADQAQKAQDNGAALAILSKARDAAKIAQIDRTSFQSFVDTAAEEGPIQDVYIEANALIETLAQANADPATIEAQIPGFTERVKEAATTNTDVKLTLGEFSAFFQGTPLEESLVPHLKTEEGGMTQVQAEAVLQGQVGEMAQEAEKLLAAIPENAARIESAQRVEEEISRQLTETNRFTPEVNKAYSTYLRNFYTVMGERIGLSAENMFKAFPIQITASAAREGVQLDANGKQIAQLAQEMSTRVPATNSKSATVQAGLQNAETQMLLVGIDALKRSPVTFEKQVAAVTQYTNFKPERSARTTEQKAERFINHMVDNLVWLHNLMPAKFRERAKLWYDGANAIANRWASKYNIEPRQAAGVIAVLSPQNPWFNNVTLAERLLDIMSTKQNFVWGNAMSEWADTFDEPEIFDAVKGKKLSELTNLYEKALWVRAYDEAYNPDNYQIVSPEGDFVRWQLNADGVTRSRKGWFSYSPIAKAISIYEDGSAANIHRMLGKNHKVRSFYNNIYAPNSPLGFTTIDTHANGAALLRPLSSKAPEVKASFGGGASSLAEGISGTYALYHEAYVRAAAQIGILPRELQSITWEAIRGMYTDVFKRSEGVKTVNQLWADYRKGRKSIDEVRAEILRITGFESWVPDWHRPDSGDATETWSSSYTGELAQAGVPGRDGAEPSATGSRDGSDRGSVAAGQAPGNRESVGGAGLAEAQADAADAAGGVEPLIGLPSGPLEIGGRWVVPGPFAQAHAVAEQYMAASGLPYTPVRTFQPVDETRATAIAAEYDAMKHDPTNPEVKAAYEAMISETIAQYEAVLASGLQVEFIDFATQGDPYAASPRLATEDVVKNNHMYVFSTRDGFGSSELDVSANPLLQETKFTISGKPALANDLFRVIHDYFGHVKDGVGFRAAGEENAWRSHSSMFSPLARRAMTSETRGQNSWVNFGPNGKKNRTASSADTVFADQKTGLLPEWVSTDGAADPGAEALEQAPTQTVTLTHYSPKGGLTTLDPAKHGTGIPGAEAKRKQADPENYIPRTYFGLEGYKPEQGLGANRYEVNIPADKLYDFNADPLKLKPVKTEGWDNPINVYEKAIRDAGFEGYIAGDVAAVFTPQQTAPAEELTQNKKKGTVRGKLVMQIGQPPNMVLMAGADLSTFLHESAHFFLEVMNTLAQDPAGAGSIKDDMNKLLSWFGVRGDATHTALEVWNTMDMDGQKRASHELFAQSFERYLMEGNAPVPELQSLFSKFRSWLIHVYKSLLHPHINVPLTDEVRGVMDRLLASEEAIKTAEEDRGYSMLFTSAEQAGMTQQQWEDYQRQGATATSDAVATLAARSIRDIQWLANAKSRKLKQLQKGAEKIRAGVEKEVRAEVSAQPIYVAKNFLSNGSLPEQNWNNAQRKILDDIAGLKTKLDLTALKEMYGDGPAAPWRYLPTTQVRAEDGIHPDVLAPLFGISSGDALVRGLLDAEKESEVVTARTDQRMLEEHGDISSPESLEAAANAAIANEARGRFLTTELNALRAATGKPKILTKAAKLAAEQLIARRVIRSLKPSTFEHAATRAAREAEKAMKAGNLVDAATEKRNQMLNHYAARAAHNARAEVQKSVDYLKKFDNNTRIPGISQDYRDQIDNLLERFQLRTVSAPQRAKQIGLLKWVENQREQGIDPIISEELLIEANRKPFIDMTVEEMRGLVDAVKNIEHIGRLKQKLLTAKDQREFDAVITELSDSITENATKTLPDKVDVDSGMDRAKKGVKEFFVIHRKFASLLRQMDGWKDGGPMWERFTRGMNEAGDREAIMRREANAKLMELMVPLLDAGSLAKKELIPEIGISLTREARIAIAMNWGNETNRLRIMQGDKWTEPQVDAILNTLTKPEWTFVQGMWNYLDTYWPLIEAKELRVTGVAPERVQAAPFSRKLADGSEIHLTGGYYPIKYDARRSSRTESQQLAEEIRQAMTGAFTRATTARGHVMQRADEVFRPVQKSFDTIFQHVSQVVHDLSWHEWLIDSNRLMRGLEGPLRAHYGPEVIRTLKDHLTSIATGDRQAQNVFERAVNHGRTGATIAGLGWNLTTSMLQPLGLTQSMVRIGPKWVGRGLAEFFTSQSGMENSSAWIMENSSFMRTRMDTMQREINEIRNRIHSQTGGVMDNVQESFFWLIGKAQLMADIPTWIGQYHKSMEAGNDHARAVALADQAVIDSQGGGQIKDLAQIQRGSPLFKLWTNFYSYFSVTYNLTAEATGSNRGNPGMMAAQYIMLFVIPSVLATTMKAAMKGDDDPEKLLDSIWREQLNYLFGTMVGLRDLASFINAKGSYSGPAGQRFFSEFAKLGQHIEKGEYGTAFWKAANNVAGIVFHYPSGAVQRLVTGAEAIADGTTANPMAVIVGPPSK